MCHMLANNIKISRIFKGLHAMAHATIVSAEVFGLHHAHAMTGEAPCWDARTGILWWIDIQGQRLLGHMPESGANLEYALPSMPGLIVCRRQGGLILGLEDGLYPFATENGLGMRLVAVEADDPRTRINDGKPDPQGRLWFGTMDKTGAGTPIGALYRLDLDGTLEKIRTDIRIPNAIDFSPDGSHFYFCDTRTHLIERFAYTPQPGRWARPRFSQPIPTRSRPMESASIATAACGSPLSMRHASKDACPTARSIPSSNFLCRARPCRCSAGATDAPFSSSRSVVFCRHRNWHANRWRAICWPCASGYRPRTRASHPSNVSKGASVCRIFFRCAGVQPLSQAAACRSVAR